MNEVRLSSIGVGLPEKKLTNADLASMVDTSDEWIVQRTGIRERRMAGKDVHTEDMAAAAAKDCLSRTDRVPDLLISSCGSANRIYPYQSSMVAHRLGLENLAAFDMCAACSGLVYSMAIAKSMMKAMGYRNALITAGEKMTAFTDYRDRKNCILFGDGASSLLLSTEAEGHELLDVEIGLDAKGSDLVTMGDRGGDGYFWQDGKKVYLFAVAKVIELIDSLKTKVGLGKADPFYVIPHQANLRMFEAVCERSGLSMDRVVTNIERFGNTSSASIGIALEEAWRENRFKEGDILFLIGFGGGLSWGGAAVRW
jgi:3-oxoacyl-[acyl-carrier-protein] synthase-3